MNLKIDKNVIKKIIATGGIALMLSQAGQPSIAKADNNLKEVNLAPQTITLQSQERIEKPMTMEEYILLVSNVYNGLIEKGINYDGMQQDIQCTVYLANIDYIYGTELEQQLINNGYIFKTDLTLISSDGWYRLIEDGWFNINAADRLIDEINDFNHRKLSTQDDKMVDTGIEEMFDISVFFRENTHDSKESKVIFENVRNFAKTLANNGNYSVEDGLEYYKSQESISVSQQISHDALTSLNSGNSGNNLSNLSTGAGWLNLRINGTTHIHFMTRYLDAKYSNKELSKYFNKQLLNEGTFYMDDTNVVDPDEIENPMLAYFVGQFGELQRFVYDTPANELFNLLGQRCITEEEAKEIYGNTK